MIALLKREQGSNITRQFATGVSDNYAMLRPFSRVSRHSQRLTPTPMSAFRVEVRPPSLRHVPESRWQRLMFWLLAPAPMDAAPPLNRLPLVRNEFLATLADVSSDQARNLRHKIEKARSLRELWHLRSDVFSLLGVALSEQQAEARVDQLNRHFPTTQRGHLSNS